MTTPGTAVPSCPACGADLAFLAERCPSCGGDLRPLLRVSELPDRCFNEAVAASHRRRWGLAAERLAVTLALRPDDVDALVLLGKVRWRQRKPEAAVAAWQDALRVAPEREDARLAVAMVAVASGRQAKRSNARPGSSRHGRRPR